MGAAYLRRSIQIALDCAFGTGRNRSNGQSSYYYPRRNCGSAGLPDWLVGANTRADSPVQFAFQRADCPVNILKLPFVAIVHHWTLRRGGPTAPNPHHSSKASLVLKHQIG